jgi:glycosyltransferase involved in cell wall biosynthesis
MGVRSWPVSWTAVSGRAAEQASASLGVPVGVMTNAVDPDEWLVARPTRHPDQPLTLVTVGRLSWTKRVLSLPPILAAVRERLPESLPLRAIVIGDGPQRRALEARAADLDWVECRGRIDREEIRTELARADVYVAPAAMESFGIAALEARSAGLPVVAHASSGVGEFVRHGTDGYLPADDAGFVAALVALLSDDTLRARMSHHNRTVRPVCDWERACARAEAAYRHAMTLARDPQRSRLAIAEGVG